MPKFELIIFVGNWNLCSEVPLYMVVSVPVQHDNNQGLLASCYKFSSVVVMYAVKPQKY